MRNLPLSQAGTPAPASFTHDYHRRAFGMVRNPVIYPSLIPINESKIFRKVLNANLEPLITTFAVNYWLL
jgi:hypothetical protein